MKIEDVNLEMKEIFGEKGVECNRIITDVIALNWELLELTPAIISKTLLKQALLSMLLMDIPLELIAETVAAELNACHQTIKKMREKDET